MKSKSLCHIIAAGTLLTIALLPRSLHAQRQKLSGENYIIFSARLGRAVDLETIIDEFKDCDILLFGEEHNDSVTHYLEQQILERLYRKYGKTIALSLEMFDRDVQIILNEYLDGLISEKHFMKDARVWSNYKDYRIMVEFAKENNIDVVAANAPIRYTNMASMKGQQSLQSLSSTAKGYIAPLPYDTATGVHYEKLMEVMQLVKIPQTTKDSMPSMKMPPAVMPSFNINQGQSLWNATMAYSIIEHLKENPKHKILHIHGKFHSDDYFGVPEYLKKYDAAKKYLVITTLSDESFPAVNFEPYKFLADYIIITDPSIPRTFSQ